MKYQDILVAYENDSQKGEGKYLSIKNVSDQDIVIEPGQKIFLNKTPQWKLEKYPKAPIYSKSIAVPEDEADQTIKSEPTSEEVADSVPF